MAKGTATTKSKGTIIGVIGATMIGAAILLFVVTMILNSIKDVAPGSYTNGSNADYVAGNAEVNATWANSNTSIGTISTILTVCVILLAVMGIVLIGSQMIAIIGGGWGG